MRAYLFEKALLPSGWADSVLVEVDDAGAIARVAAGAAKADAEKISGIALPGMPNLHCHAFQKGVYPFLIQGEKGLKGSKLQIGRGRHYLLNNCGKVC